MKMKPWVAALGFGLGMSAISPASALVFTVTVDGTDAIFLAGRTDVTIPAADQPWNSPPGGFLIRHGGNTPEEIAGQGLESFPSFIPVSGGDIIRVLDPATGGINFFNGFGPPFFGPGGNGLSGSNLTSLGGISGYRGPQGPLAGVFLDNSVPSSGSPPATLNFDGAGTEFLVLNPELRQIFYIGDGVTGGLFQQFIAPAGATRLFLAIPDGFGFVGGPGAYDDNDGSYQVRIGVNEIPTAAPEPSVLALLGLGIAGLAGVRSRRKSA